MNRHKKKDIQCLNCGLFGHTSRLCNSPTTSYGVICFRLIDGEIKYLMIQRKDSLCYVEFVRGNYQIGNKKYITKMFERMTKEEHTYLRSNSFDTIWKELWNDSKKKSNMMKNTKSKFNMLSTGYNILQKDNVPIPMSLDIVVDNSSCLKEQEWEFPKGRRKLGEKDHHCALREFCEESNLYYKDVLMTDVSKYYEEVYLSINKVRYRNIFFIGKYTNPSENECHFDETNSVQTKEVRDVKWLSYDEICDKLQARNKEKYEMFKIVHDAVKKNIKKKQVDFKTYVL